MRKSGVLHGVCYGIAEMALSLDLPNPRPGRATRGQGRPLPLLLRGEGGKEPSRGEAPWGKGRSGSSWRIRAAGMMNFSDRY